MNSLKFELLSSTALSSTIPWVTKPNPLHEAALEAQSHLPEDWETSMTDEEKLEHFKKYMAAKLIEQPFKENA